MKSRQFIIKLLLIGQFICVNVYSQNKEVSFNITTSDISNFWEAYDSLRTSKDSAITMKRLYFDRASEGFKEFLKVREEFTPKMYLESMNMFPGFWKSIRGNTENISKNSKVIEEAFLKIKNVYPEFEIPDVCFAISPFRTGGTTSHDGKILLFGTEIISIDSTVDISEFPEKIRAVLHSVNIPHMVIHESIHTAQKPDSVKSGVFLESMMEGSAEFIAYFILNDQSVYQKYKYGFENECQLWNEIKIDFVKNSNFEKWFGNYYENKQLDLGYFIGYQIMKNYYEKSDDKTKALVNIIKLKDPNSLYEMSEYNGNCGN